IGRIAWLWSDDNSNFAGLYTDGPLAGWLVKLDHDEPMLAPAWRSVGSFLERLLDSAPGTAVANAAVDLPALPRDVPALEDGPVDEIERLACEGRANGDSAAMRLLVRMRTPGSEAAVARLKQDVTGPKRQALDQWISLRDRLPPPRWY